MRQRKIKGLTIDSISKLGVITTEQILNINNIHLEIGSGKGQFITSLASDNPNINYVAMEKNINVCLRIIEKVNELKLENVIVILDDATNLDKYFNRESVSHLYLNFSDPWPKARHHKRRLTHPNFIKKYLNVLAPNSLIQFRTDHYQLFIDSLEYFKKYFNILEVNFDYKSNKYYSEYEIKRIEQGNLYQYKGILK